jgi:formiminotetrahydrofolate cyclodeaminase
MDSPTLFDLPASQLLERFGAGTATPGSGCAAALMALLSTKLIAAVARMTVEKGKTKHGREESAVVLEILDDRIAPRLMALFDKDMLVFNEVIVARQRRDSSKLDADKRRFQSEASDKLNEATDILFEVIDLSFQVLGNGISIWETGFQAAMGDAGAGISAAVAAITTCVLVINLNVRSSRAIWSREAKSRCDEVIKQLNNAQDQVLVLISQSVQRSEQALLLPIPV